MRLVAITVALIALAAPAAADAGSYVNSSSSSGAQVETSGSTIERFELYCSGDANSVYGGQAAFSLRDVVSLGKKGKFSYSGKAFRYGNEHQPLGQVDVKVSGRVTSSAVRANWSLPGCSKGSVTAPRQR
jgi:hypothetical protein